MNLGRQMAKKARQEASEEEEGRRRSFVGPSGFSTQGIHVGKIYERKLAFSSSPQDALPAYKPIGQVRAKQLRRIVKKELLFSAQDTSLSFFVFRLSLFLSFSFALSLCLCMFCIVSVSPCCFSAARRAVSSTSRQRRRSECL